MKKWLELLLCLLGLGLTTALMGLNPPAQTVSAAGVTFNYRVTDEPQNLDCELICTTTGWIGVGFDPVNIMQGANFIIGYHNAGNTFIRDDFGTSTGTHASDTSLGGVNNVFNAASSEVNGVTTLSFKIPLNSGDVFDKNLLIGGTYNIILAHGANGADSYTASHAEAGFASITIPLPTAINDDLLPAVPCSISIFPNPFRQEAVLSLKLEQDDWLDAGLYDCRGKKVSTVTQQRLVKGENTIRISSCDKQGNPLPTGVYFLKLQLQGRTLNRKLLIMN